MDQNENRKLLREKMRNFYGSRGANESQTLEVPKPTSGAVPPTMDLDSEFFDVTTYITELLRQKTLKGLVETDTELLLNVSRLDRELQELVYRNYAKFISATDTIREMKDNVVQMESKLQTLSSNVANIDKVSQSITEKMAEHRSRIEKTIATNLMLKKLQFLVDLPSTMRWLMGRGEYNVCVRCWVGGDGFLAKHLAVERIAAIRSECQALAGELYGRLEAAMCAVSLDDPEAMDNIRKYVEDLRLLRCTSLFSKPQPSSPLPDDDNTFEEAILRMLMRGVVENFAKGMAAVQREIKAALAVPKSLSGGPSAYAEVLSNANLRESLAQLKTVCAILSVNTERVYSLMNQMDNPVVGLRVSQEVAPVLTDLLSPILSSLAALAWGCLQRIAEEGEVLKTKPHLVNTAVMAAAQALTQQLKQCIIALKALGSNYLGTAESPQQNAYTAAVHLAVVELFQYCIHQFEEKACEAPSGAALLPFGAADTHPAKLLFGTSRFVYAAMAIALSNVCEVQLVQAKLIPSESANPAARGLQVVAKHLQHRGVMLLGQLEAMRVGAAWFSGESSNDSINPATTVSLNVNDAVFVLVEEWATVEAVLRSLPPVIPITSVTPETLPIGSPLGVFGTHAGQPYGKPAHGRFDSTGGRRVGGSKLTLEFHRPNEGQAAFATESPCSHPFFSESVVYFTAPWDGRPGTTMACIVLYLLKALVDRARSVPAFTIHSFQQIQLHCTFLLRLLLAAPRETPPWRWSKHWSPAIKQSVHQQLNEICASAYELYEAKTTLTDTVIDSLVGPAIHDIMSALKTQKDNSSTTVVSQTVPTVSTRDSRIETASSSAPESTSKEDQDGRNSKHSP